MWYTMYHDMTLMSVTIITLKQYFCQRRSLPRNITFVRQFCYLNMILLSTKPLPLNHTFVSENVTFKSYFCQWKSIPLNHTFVTNTSIWYFCQRYHKMTFLSLIPQHDTFVRADFWIRQPQPRPAYINTPEQARWNYFSHTTRQISTINLLQYAEKQAV